MLGILTHTSQIWTVSNKKFVVVKTKHTYIRYYFSLIAERILDLNLFIVLTNNER